MSNNENRTYIVTEVCPNCGHEVEIHGWDTGRDGFKAFCPYCGNRLMLCDECRHCEGPDCDFDSATDTCRYNQGPQPKELCIETPEGTLVATITTDPLHPGISIDIRQPDDRYELPLALIELDKGNIVSRIWGSTQTEECTHEVVHFGIDKAFAQISDT
jgi:hypothetical protein